MCQLRGLSAERPSALLAGLFYSYASFGLVAARVLMLRTAAKLSPGVGTGCCGALLWSGNVVLITSAGSSEGAESLRGRAVYLAAGLKASTGATMVGATQMFGASGGAAGRFWSDRGAAGLPWAAFQRRALRSAWRGVCPKKHCQTATGRMAEKRSRLYIARLPAPTILCGLIEAVFVPRSFQT